MANKKKKQLIADENEDKSDGVKPTVEDNLVHWFCITKEQAKKCSDECVKHRCVMWGKGAIGGSLTYSFTPTSLGVIFSAKCACGKEWNFTNFDEW